ncbi:hypothetical protein C2845_PM07G33790 [Panicum miliaceum]|uniref:PB1-like domain-containing protein n=1 Tax=Panicum miliaceum TaxID=4540 RepID=A0A3L6SHT5_PANMI|nr:hypothetical protein C2845_PM07G33790 [Panicum miliaceum]
MDWISKLGVRFRILGKFINHVKKLHYVGGSEAMSYIDRDLVSLPEVLGHLKDHCKVEEGSLLHWLFPGKELSNGLRVLTDDKACLYMSDCIIDGGVADIFVEHGVEGTDEAVDDAEYDQKMEICSIQGKGGSDDAVEVIGCSKNLVLSGKSKVVDSSSTMVQVLDSDGSSSSESDFLW